MWATPLGETYSKPGGYYSITDSPALPKPVQSAPPIVIGGGGPKRTPALAAKYAAEFNTPFVSREFFVEQTDRVRAACEAIDRNPDELVYSAALIVCVGADENEVERRAAALGREPGELRENGLCGTPAEVAERMRSWRDAGAERLYLQVMDLADLDHLDVIANDVMAELS